MFKHYFPHVKDNARTEKEGVCVCQSEKKESEREIKGEREQGEKVLFMSVCIRPPTPVPPPSCDFHSVSL